MSSCIFTSPVPDGWWPQLSPNGRHVAFGNEAISVANLKTGAVKHGIGAGRRPHWVGVQTLVFWTDGGRFVAKKTDGWVPTRVDHWTGNTTVARDGHWLTWKGGQLTFDGKVVATNTGRIADTSQGRVIYANPQGTTLTVLNGPTFRTVQEPHAIYLRGSYVSYGYWGVSRLLNIVTGEDTDITVSPWPETPAIPFLVQGQLWLASATEEPGSGQPFVLVRPYGAPDCLVLQVAGQSGLDVYCPAPWLHDEGAILLAASGSVGQLSVWHIDANEPRESLNTWQILNQG